MSDSNRKQMKKLLNSIGSNIMDSIASQREISLSSIRKHANNLSLDDAKSCLDLNYVDGLIYQDQIEEKLSAIGGGEKLNLISIKI